MGSNAEAARRAHNDPDSAAIAGMMAAELYDLRILEPNIEDEPDNTTRFLVVGRQAVPPSGDDKTTLLMAGYDGPGALHALLSPLARHSLNMSRIESRPTDAAWVYRFFVDLTHPPAGGESPPERLLG